jgi:hypothetical protein
MPMGSLKQVVYADVLKFMEFDKPFEDYTRVRVCCH